MINLTLKDRIVVEFLAPENEVQFTPEFIAGQLRAIADAIQDGRSGNNYLPWQNNEVLWEHESVGYGGFRILSDKSLISQYIYHSEERPYVISKDVYYMACTWDYEAEQKDEMDELLYTDGDMCEKAQDLVNKIISECKKR